MKNLKASSNGFTEFNLFDEHNRELGKIVYQKWFNFNVELSTEQGNSQIKMEGFWKNNMVQYDENNVEVRTIKSTWNGFEIQNKNGEELFLTWKGFLDHRFILLNKNKEELIIIHSKFDWKKFTSFYEIEFVEKQDFEPEFLLAILHCVNYRMKMNAVV